MVNYPDKKIVMPLHREQTPQLRVGCNHSVTGVLTGYGFTRNINTTYGWTYIWLTDRVTTTVEMPDQPLPCSLNYQPLRPHITTIRTSLHAPAYHQHGLASLLVRYIITLEQLTNYINISGGGFNMAPPSTVPSEWMLN